VYIQLIDESALDYNSYNEAKKLASKLLESNLKNRMLNQKGLKLLFDKHLRKIITNILIKNNKDFYFLSKVIFDRNFYTKKNFKKMLSFKN